MPAADLTNCCQVLCFPARPLCPRPCHVHANALGPEAARYRLLQPFERTTDWPSPLKPEIGNWLYDYCYYDCAYYSLFLTRTNY